MNKPDILQRALEATQPMAALELDSMAGRHDTWRDAVVRLPLSNGESEVFYVEVKNAVDRLHTLRLLYERAQEIPGRMLLAAPYISQKLAEECQKLGLNFIDTAGNAYINVPSRLVFVAGKPRPKTSQSGPQHSALRTANGLRIIFALLTRQDLAQHTLRDIAAHAGVALGSVGKVLEDLQQQGCLSLGKGERRRLLATDELLRAWVQHYPVTLRPKLNPRRYSMVSTQHWPDILLTPGEAVWGSEAAAHRMDSYLKPIEATIYSWVPRERFIVKHRLRPDPQGDVEILDAFWNPAHPSDSVIAPALLVYADLMGSPDGRSKEAASRIWELAQHHAESTTR